MKNITTKEELMGVLDISSIADIDSNKLIDIAKNNEISVELFNDLLEKTPALMEPFNQMFKTMADIGNSLEDTKRLRWQTIQELGKQGKLSGSQILEAMSILKEIEKNESIDWNSLFQKITNVAVVVVFLILGFKASKDSKS